MDGNISPIVLFQGLVRFLDLCGLWSRHIFQRKYHVLFHGNDFFLAQGQTDLPQGAPRGDAGVPLG
jgi:hypothetical protein